MAIKHERSWEIKQLVSYLIGDDKDNSFSVDSSYRGKWLGKKDISNLNLARDEVRQFLEKIVDGFTSKEERRIEIGAIILVLHSFRNLMSLMSHGLFERLGKVEDVGLRVSLATSFLGLIKLLSQGLSWHELQLVLERRYRAFEDLLKVIELRLDKHE